MKSRLSHISRGSLAGKTSFLKKLLPFLILFLSVNIVDAQIVYTDVVPDSKSTGSYNLDLNNDGTTDYLIAHTTSGGACNHINNYIKISPQNGSQCKVQVQEAGVVISSSLNYSGSGNQNMASWSWTKGTYGCVSSISGSWFYVGNGYLALELVVGGNTYYGWARLNASGAASFTLQDYAYNSNPDSSILAGQTCPPQAVITATDPTTFCAGDSVILSSENCGTNLSYKWKL
ncbi:MAG: hypothetical protein ABIO46_14165, partial [Chitinophagales bacterium]